MKKIITMGCIALLAASTAFLTSCGQKKTVLRIYTWGDYFAQDILDAFEEKYDCTIQLDEFDSNESMYAKVKAGGGGYDLIVMSTYTAKLMYEQGMLDKMDHSKLATVNKYFDKKYEHLTLDPKLEYTIPYFVSFTGIGYDTEKVKDFEPSWAMFEREDLKGRTSLLDDHREVIGCALITLGYDVNETDQAKLDEAVDLVKFAFEHAKPGDLFIQKADASTIGDLAKAVQQLFGDTGTSIIGTRHGEKLYETLMTREERLRAEDMGKYFRVFADNRDLNYDKYFNQGQIEKETDEAYTSNNTNLLDVEAVVKKILTTDYVQEQLKA